MGGLFRLLSVDSKYKTYRISSNHEFVAPYFMYSDHQDMNELDGMIITSGLTKDHFFKFPQTGFIYRFKSSSHHVEEFYLFLIASTDSVNISKGFEQEGFSYA